MRWIVLVAAAMLTVLAPSASAIESVQRASATVVPNVAGTKANPQPISLTLRAWFDDISADLDRQVQFATVNGRIYFPGEGVSNLKLFPSCTPAMVFQDERQCPAGSRIGTGAARGVGLGLTEDVTLQTFNLAGGKGVAVLVVGEKPLIIRDVVVATIRDLKGDPQYKHEVSFTIPRNLQSPSPGVIAAVTRFRMTIPRQYLKRNGRFVKRKGKRIPLLATTGCKGGSWKGKYVAEYTTSFDSTIESTQTVEVSVPCRTR